MNPQEVSQQLEEIRTQIFKLDKQNKESGQVQETKRQELETQKKELEQKQNKFQRIQKIIVLACDDSHKYYKDHVSKFLSTISEIYEEKCEANNNAIIDLFSQSITLIDHKQNTYATLFTLLTAKSEEISEKIGQKIIQNLQTLLKDAINEANYVKTINILSFLVYLSDLNCFSKNEVLQFMDKLSQKDSEFYLLVSVHIFTLFLQKLQNEWKNQFEQVKKNIMNRDLSNLKYFSPVKNQEDLKNQDLLTIWLQKIEKKLSENDFNLKWVILTSNTCQDLLKEAKINEFSNLSFHDLLEDNDKSQKKLNKQFFQIFNYSLPSHQMNKEEISSESQVAIEQNRQDLQEGLEKVYLHQLVQNIFNGYIDDKTMMLKILNVKFIQQQFSLDVESMVQIVVEVLMNQLLIIPKQYNPIPNIIDSILYTWSITRTQVNQYIHLYLSLLFNDESKIALINLKQETVDNFGLFCSRFLSQTYYNFDYEIFSPYITELQSKKDMEKEDEEEGAEEGHLSEQPFQIKEYFMLKVFRELSLLVSTTSLEKSIPESFHIFFPQKKEDIINLNYSKEEDFEYIMKMLNEKKNADSLWSYMENEDDFSLYFNIFFECLLKKMMPSQTHLRILFERYLVIFQKGKDKIDNYHAFITKKVLHFWQKSEFQLERYLIKFIDNDILSVDSIIEEILFQISEIQSQQDNQYQLIRYFQVILKLLRLQYLNYVNNEENKKHVESALDLLLEKSNKLELNDSNLDIIHEFLEQIIIYYHSFIGTNSKKIVQEMKPMLLEELQKI